MTIISSTISNNTTEHGGGIVNYPGFHGLLTLKNSIVTGNSSMLDNLSFISTEGNIQGTFTEQGINITHGFPLLLPLGNYGGRTKTRPLLPISPGYNAVPADQCTNAEGDPLATDQRGIPRPQSGKCDVGAFEVTRGM